MTEDGSGWTPVGLWLGVVRDPEGDFDRLACFDGETGDEVGDYQAISQALEAATEAQRRGRGPPRRDRGPPRRDRGPPRRDRGRGPRKSRGPRRDRGRGPRKSRGAAGTEAEAREKAEARRDRGRGPRKSRGAGPRARGGTPAARPGLVIAVPARESRPRMGGVIAHREPRETGAMIKDPIATLLLRLTLVAAACLLVPAQAAAGDDPPFEGEKSSWHDGFDRYDYLMDEATLDIQPFRRGDDERFGIKDPPKGKRRCVVIAPQEARPGQPMVVARLLLGPSAADRGRAAPSRVPRRLHLGQRDLETGQDVGCLVRLPHGEARAVPEAGIHRHESRRGIRLHLGDRESG